MALTRLGKYEIRGILGKGAMGTVYDGYDAMIDRRVAIKTMSLPESSDSEAQDELARFRREAQAAGKLTHPNIVAVFDYGEDEGVAFIVMEYAPGTELKKILDKGDRLPPAEAIRIMDGVLAGLQYSHERGVVHRDIKPGNVILAADGKIKIADFGIARIENSSMTQAGTIMGTPAYMSPEQFMGQTVDARSDLYSAGVMLYQLLTGERPFEGGMSAIMHKALNTEPPKPSDLSVTAPAALDAVVAKAMAKRPEDRFDSAAAFAEAMDRAMAGGSMSPFDDPLLSGEDDSTLVSKRGAPKPSSTVPPRTQTPSQQAAGSVPPRPATGTAKAEPPKGEAKSKLPLIIGAAVAGVAVIGGGLFFALSGGSPKPPLPTPVANVVPVPTPAPVPAPKPVPPAPPPVPVPAPAPVPVPVPQPVPVPTPQPVPVPTPQPVPIPAPQPVPVPAPEPAPRPAPAPTQAAIRDALAAAIQQASCSLTRVSVDGRLIVVSGIVGRAADAGFRQMARDALPAGASQDVLSLRLQDFDGPYCDIVDTLRPINTKPLGLTLRDGGSRLREDDYIVARVTTPDFQAWMQVDYFGSDGSLLHMSPSANAPAKQSGANAVVTVGTTNDKGWQVGPPFGTDMMVAIASSSQLFSPPRPDDDTVASYLSALRGTLEAAARQGVKISATALLVQTVGK